jgi:S-adenosylmethionine:tRNA ribosyltransferase-isomerase
MRTDDFDYDLPSGLIAQQPAEPRDSCRLLVLDRRSGQVEHRVFSDLPDYLAPGDVVVVNDTRVLPARINGVKTDTGGSAEVLLLREKYSGAWECLVKPGRRLKPGARIDFGDGLMSGLILDVTDESGGRLIQFTPHGTDLRGVLRRIGSMPLPPYITERLGDPNAYQTVFAREERSAAAPTAGLHFTERLVGRVIETGAVIVPIELDVGLDTFRPVTEADPLDHHIHTERFRVSRETAEAVNEAKANGGRVIAVGTTSVRALESAYDADEGRVRPSDAPTGLFILPGYRFSVVDTMVTNFHVPRSTLVMMVSAFAGRDLIMSAYAQAVEQRYRFLSFGDAMLIL